jgi:hypothetical protein
VLPQIPLPAAVPTAAIEELRTNHDANGHHIDARTAMPGWQGERLDVGWAISVLHPRAIASR